jgi:glucose-1-phosphate thymidylyltransferase
MKAIILAAGYATRLFPLTENFPKPLILVNKKAMIDYIVEKLIEININEIFVVTNSRFTKHFENWAKDYMISNEYVNIQIVNDKTTSNDDRLGAIGDIKYTIDQIKLNEDFVVIGGDNLFKFSLVKAKEVFEKNRKTTIVAYDVKSFELAQKYGVVSVDSNGKIDSFEEKPQQPKSTLCAICVYFYPKEVLPLIEKYLKEGNNKDAPGNLPAWLINEDEVYAVSYQEDWFDVGGFESLVEAKQLYGEENVDIEALKRGEM